MMHTLPKTSPVCSLCSPATSFVALANDLIGIFLGLELVSIPTYILLYLGRADWMSREATIKYFLLSIFSLPWSCSDWPGFMVFPVQQIWRPSHSVSHRAVSRLRTRHADRRPGHYDRRHQLPSDRSARSTSTPLRRCSRSGAPSASAMLFVRARKKSVGFSAGRLLPDPAFRCGAGLDRDRRPGCPLEESGMAVLHAGWP
ncbi:MAG UNVERIFIED_CONTAM: hypothetical protein LVR18_51120 [Planctomycetaceae bacterium]